MSLQYWNRPKWQYRVYSNIGIRTFYSDNIFSDIGLNHPTSDIVYRRRNFQCRCLPTQRLFYQLLETGFFHADPHPGNLLVTKDGRLALIDFGLMADVPIQVIVYIHTAVFFGTCINGRNLPLIFLYIL